MKKISLPLISSFSFLICTSFILPAQKDSAAFERGYVVLRDRTDTLLGDIRIVSNKMEQITKVEFESRKQGSAQLMNEIPDNKKKVKMKRSYYKGDLRYFGTATIRCRYVNWVDDSIPVNPLKMKNGISNWVTVLEEGAITLSLGFEMNQTATFKNLQGSPAFVPVFCLKKGDRPLAILIGQYTSETITEKPLSYKLDERNKSYFLSIIKEDEDLVNKIKNDQIYLYNVLEAVKEYNRHINKK